MNTHKRQRFRLGAPHPMLSVTQSGCTIDSIVIPKTQAGSKPRIYPTDLDAGQLDLKDSPTRRAMIMAGKSMPTVDKKVASILAGAFTA